MAHSRARALARPDNLVRLRDLTTYAPFLDQEGFEIIGLYPMHRWMGQSYIPLVGPVLFSQKPVLDFLFHRERLLGTSTRRQLGWLNILIAQRTGLS